MAEDYVVVRIETELNTPGSWPAQTESEVGAMQQGKPEDDIDLSGQEGLNPCERKRVCGGNDGKHVAVGVP